MKMLSISGRFAGCALLLAIAFCGTHNASASSQVCMNTGNGNGGQINYYPYAFINNTFGWNYEKSGSSECLTLNYTNGANNGVYYDGFSSTWNWPANGTPYNVKAYPSETYGWFYGYVYSGLGLPSLIYNNTNVPVYANYSITGSQSEDLIVDNWILSSANSTSPYAEMEVFVTDTFGNQTSGNLGNITLDGNYYYVSSRAAASWEAYNFIPNNGSTSGTANLNMKDYVNALVYDFGVFPNNKYFAGSYIGMEVYQGSGGITFNPAAISAN